jgi:hypothetical protein
MDLMVNPPKAGEESFPLYEAEKNEILNSLKRRAQKLVNFLNTLEGVTCNPAQGMRCTYYFEVYFNRCKYLLMFRVNSF